MKELSVTEALIKADEFSKRDADVPSVSRVLAAEVRRLLDVVARYNVQETKLSVMQRRHERQLPPEPKPKKERKGHNIVSANKTTIRSSKAKERRTKMHEAKQLAEQGQINRKFRTKEKK